MIPADEPDGTSPPRLGVIHLLAWLTVAAVLFGTERSVRLIESASNHADNFIAHYLAFDMIHLAAMAAGVVGLAALVRWRVGGKPRPLAPGHWILVTEIIPMLLIYGIEFARRVIVGRFGVTGTPTSYLPLVAFHALIATEQMFAFAAAVMWCVARSGWRCVLGSLAVASATQATLYAILFLVFADWLHPPFTLFDFLYAPAVVHAVAAVVTVAFASYDAIRIRRDWLHGLGVALVFINGLTWVGYWAASGFIR